MKKSGFSKEVLAMTKRSLFCTFFLGAVVAPASYANFQMDVDKKDKLSISGDIMAGYQHTTDFDPTYNNNQGRDTSANSFTVERAKLRIGGALQENVPFVIRLRAEEPGAKPYQMVDYAYTGYAFMPEFNVSVGKIAWGYGYYNMASATTPLTKGFLYGKGSENTINNVSGVFSTGVSLSGTIANRLDYAVTAINDTDDARGHNSNLDKRYDTAINLGFHSEKSADMDCYDADGDFRYYVGLDYAIANTTADKRKFLAPYGFFSYNNFMLGLGYSKETTTNKKRDAGVIEAGYLFEKFIRPAVGYYTYKNVKNGVYTDTDGGGRNNGWMLNVTAFYKGGALKQFAEYEVLTLSSETKRAVYNNKSVSPKKFSTGLVMSF